MTEIAGIAVYEESIMTTGKEVAERFKGLIMPGNLKVSHALEHGARGPVP